MVEDLAREFAASGGKRLRPRLVRAVFDALGGVNIAADEQDGATGRPVGISAVCEAVECFHKASLIHDDIQDGDCERYGAKALHEQEGIPLAVAAGDLLVAEGYRLLANCGLESVREMMVATAESHVRLCEGQGREISARAKGLVLSPDQILEIYALKTGEAFALAAVLGALAAGAGARLVDAARTFALNYGIAFQIADDMADGGGTLLKPSGDAGANCDPATIEGFKKKYLKRAETALDIPEFRESREKIAQLLLLRDI